jgi:FtsP/CotA-like multicopper oxidase with cupredoxin domain
MRNCIFVFSITLFATDVAQLSMMRIATGDMVPDDVGAWRFHCHVSFHNQEAMAVRYPVMP